MILVIRIAGEVSLRADVKETLYRMKLRKKYVAVLMKETPLNMKLLVRMTNFVAYGKITPAMLEQLIEKRGKSLTKKELDAGKVAKDIESKSAEELGMKGFFRLHPPRKGIDSKTHYGIRKGVLGEHTKGIDALVERML